MSPSRMGVPSRAALPAPRRWRAAWWLLPVLLLHLAALWALGRAFRQPLPHALPPALYTRVLLPRAPQPAAPEAASGRAPPSAPAPAGGTQLLQAPAPSPAPPHVSPQAHKARAPAASQAASQAARQAARPTASPAAGHAEGPAGSPGQAAGVPPQPRSPAAASSTPARQQPLPSASSQPAPPRTAQAPQSPTPAAPGPAPAPAHAAASASAPGSAAAPVPAASAASVEAWPLPTRLDYALTGYFRGPLHGTGELEWRRQGPRYELRLGGSALVDFSYTSTGTIDGEWLAPDDYAEQVLMRSKTVRFDRAAGLLRFSAIGSTMPIPAHLLDSASVFMQLAQVLRTRPGEFHSGQHLRFQVARPSGTTIWDFLVAGRQPVDTGLGRLDTWHLMYEPPARDDLGAEVWLAPTLQGLPVQIRLRHGDGDFLLFTLRRALQQAPAAEASAPR